MKLSYNWLNDFADFNSIPFEKIHEKISLSICEIDEVIEYQNFLENILAAKILETSKHPDADKLTVCKASIGKKLLQIVTGAKVEVGQIVPLAMIGTIFPDGKEIKEGKLRGVDSFGMFCSEKELGLKEESDGLYQLPNNTELGKDFRKILNFEDKILLIDNKSITHRPDLWSHFGFSRELASQLNIKIKFNPYQSKFEFGKLAKPNVVKSENAIAYYAVNIENLEIKPSLEKISSRLIRCGIKSINNVVDVSNYVLLEMGQPTHFFDREKLGEVNLEIGFVNEKKKIALLDKSTLELNEKILTIQNNKIPVALAGVMGGEESAISSNTKNSILESAIFKREDVRKTIRTTAIRTESAVRYEKGLDSYSVLPVINRSLNLLKENGCENLNSSDPTGFVFEKEKVFINTNFSFINEKLGTVFSKDIILDILNRLQFKVEVKEDSLKIEVPKFRQNYDITIEEDIVEEVGRSLGYAAIEYKPILSETKPKILNSRRGLERKIKTYLVHEFRFNEVFNYSFVSEMDNEFESENSGSLKIANQMPDEFSHLRTSTYPSILKNVRSNFDRFSVIKIFELGRTYHKEKKDELANENRFFTLAYIQNRKSSELKDLELDFYYLRDLLLSLFKTLGISEINLNKAEKKYFHPNAALELISNGIKLAEVGILHKEKLDIYEIKKDLVLAKIDFLNLEKLISQLERKKFQIPSQFPSSQIDISILMNEEDSTFPFVEKIKSLNLDVLDEIWVHDIFRGGNLQQDQKSVTYRANLINHKETFTSAAVGEILNQLIDVAKKEGFSLR